MNKGKYYQLTVTGKEAALNIYGDITSWPWLESDVSAYNIKQEIDSLDVDTISVYINSYGGEVAEALAIYSALRRNKASVTTLVVWKWHTEWQCHLIKERNITSQVLAPKLCIAIMMAVLVKFIIQIWIA